MRFLWHVALTLAVVIGVSLIAVRWVDPPAAADGRRPRTPSRTTWMPRRSRWPGPAEVRRAAEAFNFMQQRLRRMVVERGRALAAVSHDLRTPLTRMRLRAELVDDPVLQRQAQCRHRHHAARWSNSVLAYLRGLEDAEPAQTINMEALLESIVEDRAVARAARSKSPNAPQGPASAGALHRQAVDPAARDQPT